MWYIIIILFLLIIIYLYKKSTNDIFYLSKDELKELRAMMVNQLTNYSRSKKYIRFACVAFDYFALHPDKFDGTTIARDLHDVLYKGKKLEVASLIHDFVWVRFKANRKLFLNWWSNWKYFDDLLKNGKPPMYFRLIGLMVISVFYVPYNNLKSI